MTPTKTRFVRVLCMALPLAIAAALPSTSAQTLGPELLINSNFEDGPLKAYNYTGPNGWNRLLDPTYWQLVTNITPAPAGSTYSTTAHADGSSQYFIRRNVVTNTPLGNTARLDSIIYNLSSFSEDVLKVGDRLLFSLDMRYTGASGVNVWGEIQFFDASSTVILTAATGYAATNSDWTTYSTEVVVPEDAVSFRVSGVNQMATAPSAYAYPSYDNFSLRTMAAIPEPAAVSAIIALIAGAAVVSYRRKQRKA